MNQFKPILKEKIPLLVLAGPTAVGKTELAIKLALKLQTEIISADSAQVYRLLDIGTAKPTPVELAQVRHHLINIINPDQRFSAADFQKAANQAIKRFHQAKMLPLMVGGTGLYIRAVTNHYAFGEKKVSTVMRRELENRVDREGLPQLYRELEAVDPAAAAKIHPNDKRRIVRALEVYNLEGKPISAQVNETDRRRSPYCSLIYCLNRSRDNLYRRINQRVDLMIDEGLKEEVAFLYRQGYGIEAPGMQVIGYRQMLAHLQGKISLSQAVEEIKKESRNLAKRQLTWFRRSSEANWIDLDQISDSEALEIICASVKELTP